MSRRRGFTDVIGDPGPPIEGTLDPSASTVMVESLRIWLQGRGFRSGFFFPDARDLPDYLDVGHAHYAPKLAAAVSAWLALADRPGNVGKSPKQLLLKWLREHASDYGLTDDEGNPNQQGIDDTAKVANWQPSGGAPKTAGGDEFVTNPPTLRNQEKF